MVVKVSLWIRSHLVVVKYNGEIVIFHGSAFSGMPKMSDGKLGQLMPPRLNPHTEGSRAKKQVGRRCRNNA